MQAKLDSNTWRGNSASYGGAMYFRGLSSTSNSLGISTDNTTLSGDPALSDGISSNTTATSSAASKRGTIDVSSNIFIDNSASRWGGAVYLEQLVFATFVNSHMVHNHASVGGG